LIQLGNKIGNKHKKKTKFNFATKLYIKPKKLPYTNPKLIKAFNEKDIEWIGEEDSRRCIPKMSKNIRIRKFCF
jgi:hypothetical protein